MTSLAIISFRILYRVDGIYLELSISELQHLGLVVKFDLSVLFQFWWIESLTMDALQNSWKNNKNLKSPFTRNRTRDHSIYSQALYQLSYER